jgi:hypothetical protein
MLGDGIHEERWIPIIDSVEKGGQIDWQLSIPGSEFRVRVPASMFSRNLEGGQER